MVECSMVPLPPFFSEVTAVTSGLAFHSCSPALPPSRNGYKKHLGKDVLNTLVIGTILQTICHIYVYIFSVYTHIYMVDQWTMVDLQNGDVIWLVVWIIFYIFHNIWDVILPIDFHIFQRG